VITSNETWTKRLDLLPQPLRELAVRIARGLGDEDELHGLDLILLSLELSKFEKWHGPLLENAKESRTSIAAIEAAGFAIVELASIKESKFYDLSVVPVVATIWAIDAARGATLRFLRRISKLAPNDAIEAALSLMNRSQLRLLRNKFAHLVGDQKRMGSSLSLTSFLRTEGGSGTLGMISEDPNLNGLRGETISVTKLLQQHRTESVPAFAAIRGFIVSQRSL